MSSDFFTDIPAEVIKESIKDIKINCLKWRSIPGTVPLSEWLLYLPLTVLRLVVRPLSRIRDPIVDVVPFWADI